jgi:hypothetical protein
MAQAVEHLSSKHEALSSNSSIQKKKKIIGLEALKVLEENRGKTP